jgi:molybdopterin molybdotransferase
VDDHDRLLGVDEARTRILERVRTLPAEPVALAAATGRVLARPAVAGVDLPPFPSSAMDGFAVRAQDTPGRLTLVGDVAAGRPASHPLGRGEAMAISTGGAVPDGADAVVPVERATRTAGAVEVPGVASGEHVRGRGGDIRAGDEVLPAGTAVGPAQAGALAAAGLAEVVCARRPLVAVVTTGTELRPPGAALRPGEIYESNGALLEALASSAGAVVERLAPVADDVDAHRIALARGLEADVLVSSGGVSVGPHDLVRVALAALGVEEVFWGVAMRPGKPLAFGVRGTTLVFGLPGNPVSTLVAAELFVRPALLALQGHGEPGPRYDAGTLTTALGRTAWRDEFVRARAALGAGGVELTPLAGQESHMIARAAAADAIVHVPRGDGELPAGATARYLRLA